MKPYKLDLSQFGDKLRDKIDFTINNVSDQKIDISMISYASEYFEVTLPSSIAAGKTASCTLKLKQSVIDKSFEKSFTIETNDEKNSRFTIPVKRKMRPSAQAKTKTGK